MDLYLQAIPLAMRDALAGIKVDPETGEITEGLEAFEAIEASATEKIESTALYVKELAADIDAMKAAIDELTKRRSAAAKKADKLKSLLLDAIRATGKVKTAYVTVSITHRPVVELAEDALDRLPDVFKKVTVEPRKKDIMAALKAGEVIDGATLSQSESVMIRI